LSVEVGLVGEEVAGLTVGYVTTGQVVHIFVPLLPSSIICVAGKVTVRDFSCLTSYGLKLRSRK